MVAVVAPASTAPRDYDILMRNRAELGSRTGDEAAVDRRRAGGATTMRRIEWLMRGALVFCVFYVSFVVIHRSPEVFPFFGWDLFSTVPAPVSRDYSARIYGIDGSSKPTWYENAELNSAAQEVQGYILLQRLGQSLATGQKFAAAIQLKQFETAYLNSLPKVRFEIVQRTYDIRKRVDCQTCFLSDKVLGSYTNSG
jgi:hypothetical protein